MSLFSKFEENNEIVPREALKMSALVDVEFMIEDIRYVDKVHSDFGDRDAYVMDIFTDAPYVVWVTQAVVMKKLEYLLSEGLDYKSVTFKIVKKRSKSGNQYYDIIDI